MKDGEKVSDSLITRLKSVIREELSPRHVPAIVMQIDDIPVTHVTTNTDLNPINFFFLHSTP